MKRRPEKEKPIRSKYQEKTLALTEFNIDYICTCLKCGKLFMIDIEQTRSIYDLDEEENRTLIFCPYCGICHRILI